MEANPVKMRVQGYNFWAHGELEIVVITLLFFRVKRTESLVAYKSKKKYRKSVKAHKDNILKQFILKIFGTCLPDPPGNRRT